MLVPTTWYIAAIHTAVFRGTRCSISESSACLELLYVVAPLFFLPKGRSRKQSRRWRYFLGLSTRRCSYITVFPSRFAVIVAAANSSFARNVRSCYVCYYIITTHVHSSVAVSRVFSCPIVDSSKRFSSCSYCPSFPLPPSRARPQAVSPGPRLSSWHLAAATGQHATQ